MNLAEIITAAISAGVAIGGMMLSSLWRRINDLEKRLDDHIVEESNFRSGLYKDIYKKP